MARNRTALPMSDADWLRQRMQPRVRANDTPVAPPQDTFGYVPDAARGGTVPGGAAPSSEPFQRSQPFTPPPPPAPAPLTSPAARPVQGYRGGVFSSTGATPPSRGALQPRRPSTVRGGTVLR